MTPTTAAVTAERAWLRRGWVPARSMNGAPPKMKRNAGMKVHQLAMKAAKQAMSNGGNEPASFHPPRNPTNCSTSTSGPGVVSASARPSIICAGFSHASVFTAFCAT